MTGRLERRENLTQADRDQMFALLDAHFYGVTPAQFDADLNSKNWVVLIEHEARLAGFSTILAKQVDVAAETLLVIYSGDTIVSPAAWGSANFPREWIHAVYSLREHYRPGRVIWLLLTSGYRTYRFLPVFWKDFYPRAGATTPPRWQALLSELARDQYGARYDESSGIVRFERPQRLRGALADVPTARTRDPNVAFFLERNPGHVAGDELACITDLSPDNLTPAGRRVVYGAKR